MRAGEGTREELAQDDQGELKWEKPMGSLFTEKKKGPKRERIKIEQEGDETCKNRLSAKNLRKGEIRKRYKPVEKG